MEIKDKKILVTGGAGFIGSHLTDKLIACGAQVAVLDNLSTGKRKNVNVKADFYEMDLNDAALKDLFIAFRPDFVFSLAANTNVPKSVMDPLFDLKTLTGTVNAIDKARLFDVKKFIFTSSGFIYGNSAVRPIREDEPFRPISPYSISKKTVEHYLAFYREVYHLPFVVLRFATIFGPRQAGGAMADYIRKLSSGEQAEFYGRGDKTRDYLFIEDAIDALIQCLDLGDDEPAPYFNIGTGIETALIDLYRKIASLLNVKAEPLFMPARSGELEGYSLDSGLAKSRFGWSPKYTLDEGLKKTLRPYIPE